VDFIGEHWELAQKLYRQRALMLQTGQGDARLLQITEQRLRMAVAGIVLSLEDEKQQTTDAADAFVAFASRIVSETRETKLHAIYDEALELLGHKGEIADGIFDTLVLYPHPKMDWVLSRYQQHPELRAHLFRLWTAQGATLPNGLVNQAEQQTQDIELQRSALQFIANSHDYGKEIFFAHYRHLLQSSSASEVNDQLLVPAIWGGLLRGDSDAHRAFRIAVDKVKEPVPSYELLRIMALMGSAEDLPVILTYAERDPERGYPLLALFGQPAVVPHILQGLGIANTLHAAYSAWLILTNLPLPMRPRLMLVNNNEKQKSQDVQKIECEAIPDASLAEIWWEGQKQHWSDGARWYSGLPITKENLVHMLTNRIGIVAHDVTALLALHLQRPLEFGSGWEYHRQTKIKKLLAFHDITDAHPGKIRHSTL
jgi:hypothetical protein